MARMTSPTKDRNGTYVLRQHVPKRFQSYTSQKVIKRSLRTKDLAEAKRRTPELLNDIMSALEDLERQAQPEPKLSTKDIAAVCDQWLVRKLEEIEGDDFLLVDWYTESIGIDQSHREANEGAAYNGRWRDLIASPSHEVQDDIEAATDPALEELRTEFGLVIHHDSFQSRVIMRALLERFVKLSAAAYQRLGGDFESKPEAPLAKFAPAPVSTSAAPQKPSGGGILLSDLIERWKLSVRREKEESPKSADSQIIDYTPSFNRFLAFVGDVPVDTLERKQVADFRDLLHQAPSRPSAAVRRLPLKKQVAHAKEYDLATLSNNTVRNIIIHLRSLTSFAKDSGLMSESIAAGVEPARTRKAKIIDNRNHYSPDELAVIFGLPVFTEGYRPVSKGFGEAPFWVPLLCYYTGARVEEVCQLHVSQVRFDDETGVHFLRIDESNEGQGVKESASARDVPLCDDLLALGFLSYVESQPPQGRLFPQLKLSKGKGTKQKYSYNFGRWWGDYLRTIDGFDLNGRKPTHAFRHTFETHARQAGIREDISNAITGRAQKTSGGDYGGWLLSLKQALDGLPSVPRLHDLMSE